MRDSNWCDIAQFTSACLYCADYEQSRGICGNTISNIDGIWICTREKGHKGKHVACGFSHILKIW